MTAGKYLKIKFRKTLTLQKARSPVPGAGRDHHLIMPCLVSLGAAGQLLTLWCPLVMSWPTGVACWPCHFAPLRKRWRGDEQKFVGMVLPVQLVCCRDLRVSKAKTNWYLCLF